ncbi:MAG: replication-relaxation family protein [Bacteriovoracaceae bacterium]|jgi:hypothetical protein|nr:replication-relaxation family protein [Bacteriovoracaceae bacterium]
MNKKIIITQRDRQVLRGLFEQKVMDQETVKQAFFKEKSISACVKRMQKLVRGGYVNKSGIHQDKTKMKIIYSLSVLGLEVILSHFDLIKDKATFKSDSILHDLELSKLRYKIKKYQSVANYFSENAIKNFCYGVDDKKFEPYRRLNSDAVLNIEDNDTSFFIAFEYERSIKSQERYIKKILDYYTENSVNAVFYVCQSQTILNLIKRVDGSLCKEYGESKIYTCLQEDFYKGIPKLAFRNSENYIYELM